LLLCGTKDAEDGSLINLAYFSTLQLFNTAKDLLVLAAPVPVSIDTGCFTDWAKYGVKFSKEDDVTNIALVVLVVYR